MNDLSGDESHSVLSSGNSHNRYYNAPTELVRFQVPGSNTGSISGQTITQELETMSQVGRKDLQDCLIGMEKLLDHAQAAFAKGLKIDTTIKSRLRVLRIVPLLYYSASKSTPWVVPN